MTTYTLTFFSTRKTKFSNAGIIPSLLMGRQQIRLSPSGPQLHMAMCPTAGEKWHSATLPPQMESAGTSLI